MVHHQKALDAYHTEASAAELEGNHQQMKWGEHLMFGTERQWLEQMTGWGMSLKPMDSWLCLDPKQAFAHYELAVACQHQVQVDCSANYQKQQEHVMLRVSLCQEWCNPCSCHCMPGEMYTWKEKHFTKTGKYERKLTTEMVIKRCWLTLRSMYM